MTSEKVRCDWCLGDPDYVKYHDEEWGVPVKDDRKLFEFLILKGAQAGLSWLTILKRREGYRKAFADFDPEVVAKFDETKIQELLQDTGIIRNKLKVRASVSNAIAFLKVQKEFGTFSDYIWSFTNGKVLDSNPQTMSDISATSPESDALSKDLKKRGFKFVGSTIMYAHMQATGMVNDHVESCWRKHSVGN